MLICAVKFPILAKVRWYNVYKTQVKKSVQTLKNMPKKSLSFQLTKINGSAPEIVDKKSETYQF